MTSEELRKLKEQTEAITALEEFNDVLAKLDERLEYWAKKGETDLIIYTAHVKSYWWCWKPKDPNNPRWQNIVKLQAELTKRGVRSYLNGPYMNNWYLHAEW